MSVQKRKRGRPLALTEKCKARLLIAIKKGMSLKHASAAAGISYDTFNRWRNRGRNEDAPEAFRHFCKALDEAEALAEEDFLRLIQQAAVRDWKAAAWLLERRFPRLWGKQEKIEHSGPNGAPIATVTIDVNEAKEHLSPASLNALLKSFMERQSNDG